jgi:hypothetical protein
MTDDASSVSTEHSSEDSSAETRIIEIVTMPGVALFNELRTRRERLSALQLHFQPHKKMLIERLEQIMGIRVNDIKSSNTIIVTARVDAWPMLVCKGGALDLEWIRIHLNKSIAGEDSGNRS